MAEPTYLLWEDTAFNCRRDIGTSEKGLLQQHSGHFGELLHFSDWFIIYITKYNCNSSFILQYGKREDQMLPSVMLDIQE